MICTTSNCIHFISNFKEGSPSASADFQGASVYIKIHRLLQRKKNLIKMLLNNNTQVT